jgi:hypothetical protein
LPTLFFLSAAPAGKPGAVAAGLTPQALARWLEEAPTANQAQFSKALCQRLGEIQRAGFGGQALFELAELLRPAVLSVQSYLLAKVAGMAYPLEADDQASGELLLELSRLFGQMYSVLLQEYDAAPEGPAARSLGPLVQRLLRSVSHLLLAYYCLHLKIPAWLWRDLHALYRLAQQKNKAEERQRDTAAGHSSASTATEVYVQTLLLGLADPYNLQGQETQDLYQQLGDWAAAARLRPATGKAGGWLVAQDQDKPPFWQKAGDTAGGLRLDLQGLDKVLAAQLEQNRASRRGRFEPPDPNGGLCPALLRYLQRCWRNEPSGSGDGLADTAGLEILPGFRAIHSALTPAASGAGSGMLLGTAAPASQAAGAAWDATWLGDGLYGCEGDVPGRLILGALLSYRSQDGGGLGLAVVDRVLLERLGGVVKFRLRNITGRVMPAGLQPAKRDAKNPNAYQRALLYVDDSVAPVRSFVILDSLRQQEGSIVRLLTDSGMTFVKLAKRENLALGCARFECAAAVD